MMIALHAYYLLQYNAQEVHVYHLYACSIYYVQRRTNSIMSASGGKMILSGLGGMKLIFLLQTLILKQVQEHNS